MKQKTTRLFMWGYQQHFQLSVQCNAKRLFEVLEPKISVNTFLLGILRADKEDAFPVCLEPENCGFSTDDFSKLKQDAEHRIAIDPERDVVCMDPGHNRQFRARLSAKSHRDAVVALLNGWRGESNGGNYFFSGFMPVGDYDVGVVLNLASSANSNVIYRLPLVHSEERFGSYHSLLESVISEFFSDFRGLLKNAF